MSKQTEPFFRRMQHSDMSDELFLPLGHARWADGRYRLPKDERTAARTRIGGVRFQASDPTGENKAPERQCQGDVVNLVGTVRRLRAGPDMDGVVLSREILKCPQSQRTLGTRVKFGLRDGEPDDPAAARRCHRSIVRAVGRSGFAVLEPRRFDATTGMSGLEDWAGRLRLRRRHRPWWLLLLPLLLLPFLFDGSALEESFFGVGIETNSLVLLVDKSGSMKAHFPTVQAEAKRVLQRMIDADAAYFCDVIAYDAAASSALDSLQEVGHETARRLNEFLDRLAAGGGTNLRAGIEKAAAEVAKHDRPTTLVILTDGQDGSIGRMLDDLGPVLQRFEGVEIVGNTLTPRLFGTAGEANPINEPERGLRALAGALNGRFGPHDP